MEGSTLASFPMVDINTSLDMGRIRDADGNLLSESEISFYKPWVRKIERLVMALSRKKKRLMLLLILLLIPVLGSVLLMPGSGKTETTSVPLLSDGLVVLAALPVIILAKRRW